MPERQHTILATYNQAARRLTEELEVLNEIEEREEGIRSSFEELQKAMSYFDMEDAVE